MHVGIKIMLGHRNRTSIVRHIDNSSIMNSIIYTMEDDMTIVVVSGSLKKQHGIAILSYKVLNDLTDILVIADKISRPARIMMTQESSTEIIESLEMNICVFDRMKSIYVPKYRIVPEQDIVDLEKKHKCERNNWPILKTHDPIARYLGLKDGMVVVHGIQQTMRIVKEEG
jgi:DNA-directed RNA polymerase subunit H (RpoH/RPB5)